MIKCSEVAEYPSDERVFKSMACSVATELGPGLFLQPFFECHNFSNGDYVDAADLIDIPAEIQKKKRKLKTLTVSLSKEETIRQLC